MRFAICSLLCLLFTTASTKATAQSLKLGRDGDGKMVAYRQPIPGTDIGIDMVPIPGATLQLDEDTTVKIAPFWIGKYEVTCGQYGEFMKMYDVFAEFTHIPVKRYAATKLVDSVSVPTPVYEPQARFKYSRRVDSPAASMSQFGARQFTKWLSLLTETDYRLPRESEWKHACLAGGQRGNEWSVRQQAIDESRTAPDHVILRVGLKQPNAWGVHDMHGNVAEYVIEDAVAVANGPLPKKYRHHRAYGGSFVDPPKACQWNSFVTIDREWWDEDANFPQSLAWLANLEKQVTVGFRIIRPAAPMTDAQKKIAWDADSDRLQRDDEMRIDSGRGKRGKVDAGLPQAIREHIDSPTRLTVPWDPIWK